MSELRTKLVLLVTVGNVITRLNNIDDETPKRIEIGLYIPAKGEIIYLHEDDRDKFSANHDLSTIRELFEEGLIIKEISVDYRPTNFNEVITITCG